MLPVARVVVAGRDARPRWRRRFGRSSVDRVAGSTDASVLVVERLPIPVYQRPLVATSLDDDAARMMSLAVELCDPAAVDLVLVHTLRVPFHATHPLFRAACLEREIEAAALDAMREVVHAAGLACDVELVTRHGDPGDVLLSELGNRRCDLAVVGAHDPATIPRLLRGSIAARVLAASPCDVLVIGRRRP